MKIWLLNTLIVLGLITLNTIALALHFSHRFNELKPRLTRAYELDIIDDKYILYDGDIPISILDSSEVGKLHYVISKDNE